MGNSFVDQETVHSDLQAKEKPKKYLVYSAKKLTQIPDLSTIDLSAVQELFFDNNEITKIEFDSSIITKLKKLKKISFYKNNIKEIPENLCEFDQLEHLSLDMNKISSLPKNFSSLINLKELSLFLNRFKTINISSCQNLHDINLSSNCLTEIDVSQLKNLQYLNLASNKLKEIPKGIENLKNLEMLNLWFNEISDFDIDFENLESLKSLDISYNHIKKLNDSFSKLSKLDDFAGIENEFESLPTFPLSICKIEMKKNKLKSIENIYSKEHKNLREIDFSFNQIEKIDEFPPLCMSVNFTYNKIKEIPIEGSQYIAMMLFSHNEITTVPNELSNSLYLTKLDLGFNKIKKIPRDIILKTKNIQHLILAKNELESFLDEDISTEDSISQLNFRRISLGFNQIKNLPEEFFNYCPHLTELDVCWNNLENLPKSLDLLVKLQYLHLGGNKLKDDAIESFSKIEHHLKQLILSDNEFKEIPKYEERYAKLRECIQNQDSDKKVGEAEMIGKRSSSEDSMVIEENFDDNSSLFAVFDGHGGSMASKLCAQRLRLLTKDNLSKSKDESFEEVFSILEKEVCDKCPKSEGTTATVVYIKDNELTCSNVGDSRSIICSKEKSKQISIEHKPTFRNEHQRIRKIDGYVTKDSRVEGIIAVSRSLGDLTLKKYLSSIPDILTTKIEQEDEYIIICCDGVWDVLNNEEVREIVNPKYDCNQNARRLRDCAFALGSTDNISSIVIKLK
eukprot:gene2984-4994_t